MLSSVMVPGITRHKVYRHSELMELIFNYEEREITINMIKKTTTILKGYAYYTDKAAE